MQKTAKSYYWCNTIYAAALWQNTFIPKQDSVYWILFSEVTSMASCDGKKWEACSYGEREAFLTSPTNPWMHIECVTFYNKISRNKTISMNLPLCICFSAWIGWSASHSWCHGGHPPSRINREPHGTKWRKVLEGCKLGSQLASSETFEQRLCRQKLETAMDDNVLIPSESMKSLPNDVIKEFHQFSERTPFLYQPLTHNVVSLKVAVPMHCFQQRIELASPRWAAKAVQHGNRTCFGTSGINFLMLPQYLCTGIDLYTHPVMQKAAKCNQLFSNIASLWQRTFIPKQDSVYWILFSEVTSMASCHGKKWEACSYGEREASWRRRQARECTLSV